MDPVPLLLLPGLLNDARLWQHQVPVLSARREVRVADLTQHDSIAALADDALAAAPAGRFALVGFSMGGYVALEVMRRAPERVAALGLFDTSARADTAMATKVRQMALAQAETDFGAVVDGFPPKVIHPAHMADAALVETIKAMSHGAGKVVFGRQQRAVIGRVDSRPHLADIDCRTLVLAGREDQLTPLNVQQELAAAIPGAQLVVIEQCGHLAPLEQPDQVTQAMENWLALVDAEA